MYFYLVCLILDSKSLFYKNKHLNECIKWVFKAIHVYLLLF
jgi:hypothetical protein